MDINRRGRISFVKVDDLKGLWRGSQNYMCHLGYRHKIGEYLWEAPDARQNRGPLLVYQVKVKNNVE